MLSSVLPVAARRVLNRSGGKALSSFNSSSSRRCSSSGPAATDNSRVENCAPWTQSRFFSAQPVGLQPALFYDLRLLALLAKRVPQGLHPPCPFRLDLPVQCRLCGLALIFPLGQPVFVLDFQRLGSFVQGIGIVQAFLNNTAAAG